MAIAVAGCHTRPTNLDRTVYDRQIPDSDGFLMESDRRYVVIQFTQSRMDGVVDGESVVAYVSLPRRADAGIDFGDPGFAFGWSSVAVVLSDMFHSKDGVAVDPLPSAWGDPVHSTADTCRLMELCEQRETICDPAVMRELEAARELQIVDYGKLLEEERDPLAIDSRNPQNRPTD